MVLGGNQLRKMARSIVNQYPVLTFFLAVTPPVEKQSVDSPLILTAPIMQIPIYSRTDTKGPLTHILLVSHSSLSPSLLTYSHPFGSTSGSCPFFSAALYFPGPGPQIGFGIEENH